jgi:excisionase family DNA binding protein
MSPTAEAQAPKTFIPEVEACWTVEDVARYLRIGRTTALLWIDQGRLPKPKKVGRRFLWNPDTIRALMSDQAPQTVGA